MKQALMTWGGWEEHQPQQSMEVFAPFLREHGYQVHIADTLVNLHNKRAVLHAL
jgi:uncharacterized protein